MIRGTKLICPRCKRYHDVVEYPRMERIEEYVEETNVIVRCPSCNWKFSPCPAAVEMFGVELPPELPNHLGGSR